ncbi:unnamed protein product [Litomosoides sigmodontis]|uniref:MAT1 C-terminal CAK anchor domain-containing protein n=1 Tax=Litomosoides sigmodontis TaxID=42156 RepID=A0A3P6V9X7_LITSI|nr:unnamed protein product [Litomosoides sigmodontis]
MSKMETEQTEKGKEDVGESSLASVRIGGAPFVYRPPVLPINGPPLPKPEDLSRLGYLQNMPHINEKNGSTPEACCMRALFDARVDLFSL